MFPSHDDAANTVQSRANELTEIFLRLNHIADELWESVNKYELSLINHEVKETNDPREVIRSMRRTSNSAKKVSKMLRSIETTSKAKINGFDEQIRHYEHRIRGRVLNWGLSSIPDELVLQIIIYASNSLGSIITLSHVCRRFRLIIVGCRKLWRMSELSLDWSVHKIQVVAERGGPPLRASLLMNGTRAKRHESRTAILQLHEHLEELRLSDVTATCVQEVWHYFENHSWPILRALSIGQFWPDAFFSQIRFPGEASMPSLKDLNVNFIPHASWAGSLVRCILRLTDLWLYDLLEFLSQASSLQELSLAVELEPRDEYEESLDSISLPNLQQLRIELNSTSIVHVACIFMDTIVPFVVPKVHLCISTFDVDVGEIATFLKTRTSIRELTLEAMRDYMHINFDHIPRHIRVLCLRNVSESTISSLASCSSETLPGYQLQLLRFKSCRLGLMDSLHSLTSFLSRSGLGEIELELQGCSEVKDGVYGYHDITTLYRNHLNDLFL